jgi:hypothetical protein
MTIGDIITAINPGQENDLLKIELNYKKKPMP